VPPPPLERVPSHRRLQGDGTLSLVECAHNDEIEARASAIENVEEVVERLERLPRRCDEQVAALEAGASSQNRPKSQTDAGSSSARGAFGIMSHKAQPSGTRPQAPMTR
jgi:hypothetical protein